MPSFFQEKLQSVGDVLPGSFQSQYGVVKGEAFKHGDSVGDTAADFES